MHCHKRQTSVHFSLLGSNIRIHNMFQCFVQMLTTKHTKDTAYQNLWIELTIHVPRYWKFILSTRGRLMVTYGTALRELCQSNKISHCHNNDTFEFANRLKRGEWEVFIKWLLLKVVFSNKCCTRCVVCRTLFFGL